jgi:hypothetical protein
MPTNTSIVWHNITHRNHMPHEVGASEMRMVAALPWKMMSMGALIRTTLPPAWASTCHTALHACGMLHAQMYHRR